MAYDIEQFKKEIKKRTDYFLRLVASECRRGFEYDRPRNGTDEPGFPIFHTADPMFYQSKFQEGYLEWMIRDQLVNELLNYLFVNRGYDIRWRFDDSRMTTGGFRNIENEKKFPVEFFLVIDGEYTAYCYTSFSADYSIPENLPFDLYLMYYKTGVKKISRWVSIYWTEKSREEIIEEERLEKFLEGVGPFQTITTIKDLFKEFFSKEEYEIFIKEIRKAVSEANKLMGFQTIPRLVSNNIAVFKEDMLKELSNTDFSQLEYSKVNEEGDIIPNILALKIRAEDNETMMNQFEGMSRYFSLAGTKKHAQSFLTSEYLYHIFREGTAFDYTSVVSGYIKSVEQLCACIVYEILVQKSDPLLYIKCRSLKREEISLLEKQGDLKKCEKYYYVSMKEENRVYFDYKQTMGQLFYFFHINKDRVLCIDSVQTEPIMFECMKNYLNFDRNGFFHKHNINDFSIVKRIRNNTLIILYWILGATVLFEELESNLTGLGIVDTSFERLFKKIAYRYRICYLLKMKGGAERKVVRLFTKNEYTFDSSGYLQGARLQFCEVNEYPRNHREYRDYVENLPESSKVINIDNENLPEKIYFVNNEGRAEEIKY